MAFDFQWQAGLNWGRGIGREVAQFVAAGARGGAGSGVSRNRSPLCHLAASILATQAKGNHLLRAAGRRRLDVLVSGAGVRLGPTETLSDDGRHDCMTVNASDLHLLQALVLYFRAAARFMHLTIGSNAAKPHMQMAAYCLQAAVTSLTQTVGWSVSSACAPTWCRWPDGYPHAARHAAKRGSAAARTIAGLLSSSARHPLCARSPPWRRSPIPSFPGLDLAVPHHAAGSGRRRRRHPECLRFEKQIIGDFAVETVGTAGVKLALKRQGP